MKLEQAFIRSGHAKNISEARIIIEKTRAEAGSDEDYYKFLFERYGISNPVKTKRKIKPKKVRKIVKNILIVLIIISTGIFAPLALAIDQIVLGWVLIILCPVLIIALEKKVEDIDRKETFK